MLNTKSWNLIRNIYFDVRKDIRNRGRIYTPARHPPKLLPSQGASVKQQNQHQRQQQQKTTSTTTTKNNIKTTTITTATTKQNTLKTIGLWPHRNWPSSISTLKKPKSFFMMQAVCNIKFPGWVSEVYILQIASLFTPIFFLTHETMET